jgi:hypothetical protein
MPFASKYFATEWSIFSKEVSEVSWSWAVKVCAPVYNGVVIEGIEFDEYDGSFDIGVLDEIALNPLVVEKDIFPKVLYEVDSFKEGMLDNNCSGTILKLERAFDIVSVSND